MSKQLLIADRYRIENPDRDLLGRGGMGEVYRVPEKDRGQRIPSVRLTVVQAVALARND